jgi:uncharacterized DUF497 family protein
MILGYEWDDEKNMLNIRKHGIAFEDAILVFNDPLRLELYDPGHSTIYEERWRVYGFAGGVLAVSFTERNGMIRIISARRAQGIELEAYYGNS